MRVVPLFVAAVVLLMGFVLARWFSTVKPMGHDVSKYSDASPRRISSLPTSSSFAAAAAKIESMLRNGDIYTTESPLYSLPLCKNSRSYENFSVVVPLGNPKIPQVHWSVVKVPWISRYDNGEWMKENRADSESEDACAVLSYAVIKAMYPVGSYRAHPFTSATAEERDFGELGRAADWPRFQGAGDVWALHITRMLHLCNRLPVRVMEISRSTLCALLQPHIGHCTDDALHPYNSLLYVSVQAFIDGFEQNPPDEAIMRKLRKPPKRVSVEDHYTLSAISDVLAMDFLLDDHDRNVVKNWIWVDSWSLAGEEFINRKTLLQHDNGGSFFSGPVPLYGFEESPSAGILCGKYPTGVSGSRFSLWGDFRDNHFEEREGCKPICYYRNSTVQAVRGWVDKGFAHFRDNLSSRLTSEGSFSNSSATCNWAVYQHSLSRRHYLFEDCDLFLRSVFHRARQLLDVVDNCIDNYGERRVLSSLATECKH